MKIGLNKTQLIGNVGRDNAVLGNLPSGSPVLNFSFAVNDAYKDKKSGEEKQSTEWFKVVIYGERAKSLARYITSGKPLYLEGTVSADAWNGEDGAARADLILKVDELRFLDSSSRNGNTGKGAETAETAEDKELFPD